MEKKSNTENVAEQLSNSDVVNSEETASFSKLPPSEPMLPDSSAGRPSDIDQGWAWMVMVGSTIMQFLLGGLVRSFGIVFVKWMEHFNSSAAITVWVAGTASGITLMGSPVAVVLAKKFSVKLVTFVGACMVGSGFILSGFGQSIGFMFFSISFLAGIGSCLTYSPSIVHVGEFFDKKRSLAMGISHAGMGIGALVLAPIVNTLYSYYGFLGYHIIVGAITLNLCVAALLYRPRSYSKTTPTGNLAKHENTAQTELLKENGKNATNEFITNTQKVSKETFRFSNLKALANFRNVCLFIGLSIPSGASDTARLFIFDHAVRGGIDITSAALLLSAEGVSDTVGKILSGFLFDIPTVRRFRSHLYYSTIAGLALTFFIIATLRSYVGLMLVFIVHGLLSGCMAAQKLVITADIVGLENLSISFGIVLFLQGVCLSFAPFVAGALKDIFGSYVPSYCWCGALALCSFILVYISHFYNLYKKGNKKQNK